MGIAAVLASNPGALTVAAGQVGSSATDAEIQIASGRGQFMELEGRWTGTAADRAQANAEEMIGDQEIYHGKLVSLEAELRKYGQSLFKARDDLSTLVNSPEASLFDIDDDGSVFPGWRLLVYVAKSARNAMDVNIRRLKIQTSIETALDMFDAADKAAAAAIRKADRS